MNFENEEFYNLNKSLRSQVSYLIKDYSKLKAIIKSSEASSKRVSDNLGPIRSKMSGLNSFASNALKVGSKALGDSLVGSKGSDLNSVFGNIFGKFFGGMRANGGNVSAGVPYVVGERGAEIFTPDTSGYISSNNNVGGRNSVNITMNISTPDVSGFQRSEKQIINNLNRAMSRSSR